MSEESVETAIGTIDGFTDLRLVGRGGSGSVVDAYEILGQRRVAIKVLKDRRRDTAAFEAEYAAMANLGSDHIVRTFQAVATSKGYRGFVMELLPRGLPQATSSTAETARLMVQVGESVGKALSVARINGVLHLDVKPSNIRRATDGRIKLIDFGASSKVDEDRLRACTPAYAAPEVLRRLAKSKRVEGDEISHPADIWSLGATLYVLACSQPPFGRDQNMLLARVSAEQAAPFGEEISTALPAGLERFVLERMLAKDPQSRPDAPTVAERFSQFAAGLPSEVATAQPSPIAVSETDELQSGAAIGSGEDAHTRDPAPSPDPPQEAKKRISRWTLPVLATLALAAFVAAALFWGGGDAAEQSEQAQPTSVPLPTFGAETGSRLVPVKRDDIIMYRADGDVVVEFESINADGTTYEFRVGTRPDESPLTSSGEPVTIEGVSDSERPCVVVTVISADGESVLPSNKSDEQCLSPLEASAMVANLLVPFPCERGACSVQIKLLNALPSSNLNIRVTDPNSQDPNSLFGNAYPASVTATSDGQIEWEFSPGEGAPPGRYRIDVSLSGTDDTSIAFFTLR